MPQELLSVAQLAVPTETARQRIADNWQATVDDVAGAARAAGRDPGDVAIIGVSKYVDAEITRWLIQAGCRSLGENRPQVLLQKHEWLQTHPSETAADEPASPVRWHQIGHLQRNKVRRLLDADPMIHSVDSARLLDEIISQSSSRDSAIELLIEINVSGEDAKTGLPPEQLGELIEAVQNQPPTQPGQSPHVRLVGLMAMAGWGTDADQARRQFASLRQLRDTAATASGMPLPHLSMGMSGDYEAAIAEGATMVRIGSRLFDGLR